MDYFYIDHNVLHRIWMIKRNTGLIADLIELYQAGVDESLANLHRSCQSQDRAGLASWTHRLKGSSANVGAVSIFDALHEIEQILKTNSEENLVNDLAPQLSALEELIPKTMDELNRLHQEFKV